MAKYYYRKNFNFKKILRIFGISLIFMGGALFIYILFPILSWQIFFAGTYSPETNYPIPKTTVVGATFENLLSASNLSGIDYTNAGNWFPTVKFEGEAEVPYYTLSVPKLGIQDANVSTVDQDLAKNLVSFNPSQLPPEKGNTVIFGHSTLPYLYDPNDYKTVFANLYKLKEGDEIFTKVNNVSYKYRIFEIKVVEANDTSVLAQQYNDSFLTLITCTPPGTVWKRLIIKARLTPVEPLEEV